MNKIFIKFNSSLLKIKCLFLQKHKSAFYYALPPHTENSFNLACYYNRNQYFCIQKKE